MFRTCLDGGVPPPCYSSRSFSQADRVLSFLPRLVPSPTPVPSLKNALTCKQLFSPPPETRADAEGDGDAPSRLPGVVRGFRGAAAEGRSFLRAPGDGQDAHGAVRGSAHFFKFVIRWLMVVVVVVGVIVLVVIELAVVMGVWEWG